MGQYVVEMNNIVKEFPGVKALQNVQFTLEPGEVHILLGENGAGKSTLMKILCGAYTKTSGSMKIDGRECDFKNVQQAQSAGVSMIYQELNLLPNLTVAENILFGHEIVNHGVISWRSMYRKAQEVLKDLNLKIDPRAMLGTLSVGDQQMVEIAHAVSRDAKVIIMDEPTSALTDKEVETLFRIIRDLKEKKVGIVYISHRLEELLEIGDRATVMRDGAYIGTQSVRDEAGNITIRLDDLIRMMVGRELDQQYPKNETVTIGDVGLRAEHICCGKRVRDCSFYVRKGEIVGLSGLMGAGRTELARAIIGADKKQKGSVYVNGKAVDTRSPQHAKKSKIGYLPEDRKKNGLILNMDIRENITLANMDRVLNGAVISYAKERKLAQEYVERLTVKTPSLRQKIRFLSGGNQQKAIIAKWLFTDCEVLIFDEPTRGIDVGAKFEIYKLLGKLSEEGKTIVVISSEIPEIMGICDRIYVMYDGQITGELPRSAFDQDRILEYAIGQKHDYVYEGGQER